jgi:hypothetical protein
MLDELELRFFFRFIAANPISVMQMLAPERAVVGTDEVVMLDDSALIVRAKYCVCCLQARASLSHFYPRVMDALTLYR